MHGSIISVSVCMCYIIGVNCRAFLRSSTRLECRKCQLSRDTTVPHEGIYQELRVLNISNGSDLEHNSQQHFGSNSDCCMLISQAASALTLHAVSLTQCALSPYGHLVDAQEAYSVCAALCHPSRFVMVITTIQDRAKAGHDGALLSHELQFWRVVPASRHACKDSGETASSQTCLLVQHPVPSFLLSGQCFLAATA